MSQEKINADLELSGLELSDMSIRALDLTERAACQIPQNINGYVIPYYNIAGKLLPFYRARLFDYEIKYKQVKDTPNHVYFPKKFLEVCNGQKRRKKYIILTEGEKKATRAVNLGFACAAFGGVDSWRNRIILLPKGTELSAYSYNKQLVGAKLPNSSFDTGGLSTEPVAAGFEELATLVKDNDMHIIIIYDSDETTGTSGIKTEVQRAAADLGFELRRRGIPLTNIRQAILPHIQDTDKTGLDDFLTLLPDGVERLQKLIDETLEKRSAFPRHPNMEADLNKKLQNAKLSRKDITKLSLNIITDLDARGIRMFNESEQQLYYFQEKGTRLIKVDMTSADSTASTPFGKFMYQSYGLSMKSDIRLMNWIATQFSGEAPLEAVRPYRVIARDKAEDNCIRYQINDGQYAKITADPINPIEILHNGSENVLFESGQVESLNAELLVAEFTKRSKEPLKMWWGDVLEEVRLKDHGNAASVFALLYYVSPWLFRWRGSQLPVELILGEAGSGKSTLCELRMSILQGEDKAKLRNAPADIKDWYASIANTGGLHVTDNVQLVDRNLRNRLSDEICRLITETHPSIEMRRLYANNELISTKVDAVFAFTAVTQPFTNSDILQRAIIVELDKTSNEDENTNGTIFDSAWKKRQIDRFGGRTAWVSHHLYVLHLFLRLVDRKWKHSYKAKHRLINLEQTMMLMAELFGIENSWLPGFLSHQVDASVVDSDWTLEGLCAFVKEMLTLSAPQLLDLSTVLGGVNARFKNLCFTTGDIASWAARHEAFMECHNLVNARKLARYIATHKAMISQIVGLSEIGKENNKMIYKIKNR